MVSACKTNFSFPGVVAMVKRPLLVNFGFTNHEICNFDIFT